MRIVLFIFINGLFWGASQRCLAEPLHPSSQGLSQTSHQESQGHQRRTRQREISDNVTSEVSQEDSDEVQKSLDRVFNTLLWINSGRERTPATN